MRKGYGETHHSQYWSQFDVLLIIQIRQKPEAGERSKAQKLGDYKKQGHISFNSFILDLAFKLDGDDGRTHDDCINHREFPITPREQGQSHQWWHLSLGCGVVLPVDECGEEDDRDDEECDYIWKVSTKRSAIQIPCVEIKSTTIPIHPHPVFQPRGAFIPSAKTNNNNINPTVTKAPPNQSTRLSSSLLGFKFGTKK